MGGAVLATVQRVNHGQVAEEPRIVQAHVAIKRHGATRQWHMLVVGLETVCPPLQEQTRIVVPLGNVVREVVVDFVIVPGDEPGA